MTFRFSARIVVALLIGCLLVIVASHLLFRYHHRAAPTRPAAGTPPTQSNPAYLPPRKIADLKDKAIKESSGLAASRTRPGGYWTHNDSGDGPFLYAFDVNGQRLGVWEVTGAKARDWESMAAGPGPKRNTSYLYIGDIGDNSGRRDELRIYRIPEPVITAGDAKTTKAKPAATGTAEVFLLRYPSGYHDSEALLVHPITGSIYIVTKVPIGNPRIYSAPAPLVPNVPIVLKDLGELSMPGWFNGVITDGAISPDGTRLALCDYRRGYELVLAKGERDFDSIWKQPLVMIDLGERKQGEAITYRLDGRALMATSERLPTPLIEIVLK